MTKDEIKVEELIKQVKATSGKDDVCIICYKDQEEHCKELFPSKKIHVLPEKLVTRKINNAIFIIPIDVKPIKVVYEESDYYM